MWIENIGFCKKPSIVFSLCWENFSELYHLYLKNQLRICCKLHYLNLFMNHLKFNVSFDFFTTILSVLFVFVYFEVVRPSEPDHPDPNCDPEGQAETTQPDFEPWGPNPTQKRVGFIKYIIGLNLNLNPSWGQPDLIGPIFGSWGSIRPVWTQKLGPKLGRVWPH